MTVSEDGYEWPDVPKEWPGKGVEEDPTDYRAVVVGGGIGGICATLKLLKAGIQPLATLERASEVGGVWQVNQYPGCACDVPAHLYSYADEDDVVQWTHFYPSQAEMVSYLRGLVVKYGLDIKGILRLRHHVLGARWCEERQRWEVVVQHEDDQGQTVKTLLCSQFLVASTGALVEPRTPDLPGVEDFKGVSLHTARWDGSVDLRGKRVGVVGTGASAVQVVSGLAPLASHLTVFQRTASWVFPKFDFKFPAWAQWLLRWRHNRRIFRILQFYSRERYMAPVFLKPGKTMSQKMTAWGLKHLQTVVTDPALRQALTPNYMVGCKRVLLSDDFYESLMRDNVELVASGVQSVQADGVTDSQGRHHPLDVIVWATGFDLRELWHQVGVWGREDVYWGDVMGGGLKGAYLGMLGPRLPNFWMTNGPNTALGHNSLIIITEAQCRYMVGLIRKMDACGATVFDVRQEVWEAYRQEMHRRLPTTVWWTGGCRAWYRGPELAWKDVLWPGTLIEFRRRTRTADPSLFHLQDANGHTVHWQPPSQDLHDGKRRGWLAAWRLVVVLLVSGAALMATQWFWLSV